MTSDALAVVRAFFELASARDYDGLAHCLDAKVVWLGTRGGMDERMTGHGPDGVVAYLREVEEPWQRFDVTLERLIDLGDRVVAFMLETGQARHGDLEVHRQTAMVFKVAGQKIVELRGYLDREEALHAAEGTN